MHNLATAMIRPGEYVAAQGDNMVGRIKSCPWHGFRAVTLDGRELPTAFDTINGAAEVLALEFAMHYGESISA